MDDCAAFQPCIPVSWATITVNQNTFYKISHMLRKSLRTYISTNKPSIIILSVFVFGLSLYINTSYFVSKEALRFYPPFIAGVQHTANTMLGSEYYAIAEALVAGKGFSNPFRVDTGPTAWMPPLYPFILAALISVLPSKPFVAIAVIFIKNIVLILTGLFLYEIAKKTRLRVRAGYVLIVYCLWLLCNFRWFFQLTHDEWLLLFLMNIVFAGAVFLRRRSLSVPNAVAWGVLGGLVILASPIAGLVWITLSLANIARNNNAGKIFAAFIIMGIISSPWVIRNYLVFDRIILMKSNFYFDIYHNNQTQDGIVHDSHEVRNHPFFTVPQDPASLYRRVGEMQFVDAYKEKFLQDIRQHPDKYLTHIKNRLLAALIRFYPYTEHELLVQGQAFFHALPFLGILALALLRRGDHAPYVQTALAMYVLYLTPYILVSYYMRYSIPLTQIKILFIFWAIDRVVARFAGNHGMRSQRADSSAHT